jgi:hypothetical protein
MVVMGGSGLAEIATAAGMVALAAVAGVTSRDAQRILNVVADVAAREGMRPLGSERRDDDVDAHRDRRPPVPELTHGR